MEARWAFSLASPFSAVLRLSTSSSGFLLFINNIPILKLLVFINKSVGVSCHSRLKDLMWWHLLAKDLKTTRLGRIRIQERENILYVLCSLALTLHQTTDIKKTSKTIERWWCHLLLSLPCPPQHNHAVS